MSNLIQIKRSITTASPTGLANGEFAYTANGDVLFIGSNSAIVPIAGARYPGVLTANQALVANATSGIDKIIVSNAVVTSITANGSLGSAGQYLASDGSNTYWITPPSTVNGSNTQVQFNNSGEFGASAGFTFDSSTNNVTIANTLTISYVEAGQVNATFVGDGTAITNVDAATLGGNSITDITTYVDGIGNSAYQNAIAYAASNTYVNSTFAQNTDVYGTFAQNTSVYSTFAQNSAVYSTFAQNTSVYSTFAQNTSVYSTFAQNTTVYSTFAQNTDVYSTFAQNSYVSSNFAALAQASFTGNVTLGGAQTTVTSNLVVSGKISSDLLPSANITYSLGNNTLRFNEGHFKNVHSVDGYFDGSVSINGDLTVVGNVTTTNVNSVVISDPLIYLAGNNYSSDAVDIGFVGNYHVGGNDLHTGLFRHASDDTYYLFKGLTQELDSVSVVNVADPTFAIADLKAYLLSGALVSNSSAVTITANSTVNVNISANTLTLTTPLAGTSGGLGLNTYTAEDIVVANSSNGFRKLSLGTSGYVLQSNGTALVYATLDGGSF